MAIKDYYDNNYAEMMAEKINEVYPTFDQENFLKAIDDQIEDQAYSVRMKFFAETFEKYLPSYTKALEIFQSVMGEELSSIGEMYKAGAYLAPIGKYIELYAPENPDEFNESIAFVKELTKRYTGEFTMRPILQAFPEETLTVLKEWSQDESVFVRRCASECMRVSLPWAKKMTVAVENFSDYSEILGNMRYDESEYVHRSIGNNLNDFFKYDHEKAQSLVDTWLEQDITDSVKYILHHGTRTIRKKNKDKK